MLCIFLYTSSYSKGWRRLDLLQGFVVIERENMMKVGTSLYIMKIMIFIVTATIDFGSPEVIPSRVKRRGPVNREQKSARLTVNREDESTPAMDLNSKQDINNTHDNVPNQHEE